MKEALLYEKLDGNRVGCYLCAHHCKIADKEFGFCGVRQNKEGALFTHAYGKVIAAHIDPIEKKPLYHFLPGSNSFSIATIGCNFRCGFCQNWQISQAFFKKACPLEQEELAPEQIVKLAKDSGCKSISYTYTEPTIFFEYAFDTAKTAKESGLKNVFVTNGYMTKECLEMISPYLDAANVDLKFFKEESYKKICSARLEPVLESIKQMHKMGLWLEITTLVIPGENDSEEELSAIARFIAGVDEDIPWHVSRFHPDYKFNERKVTAEAILKKAEDIGRSHGLNYVYAGNVYGWGSDTVCPECKKPLIKREGFTVTEDKVKKGACSFCGKEIPGVFALMIKQA